MEQTAKLMKQTAKSSAVGIAAALGLLLASCGSTDDSVESAAADTTAQEVVVDESTEVDDDTAEMDSDEAAGEATDSSELRMVLPEGWTVAQEFVETETAALGPEVETDVVCPDGSDPRPGLNEQTGNGAATTADGEFVAFVRSSWDSEEEAAAYLATWGEGKCEVGATTVDEELVAQFVNIDTSIDIDAASGHDSVAVIMSPDEVLLDDGDLPDPTGVLLVRSGSDVMLLAATGADDPQAVLQEVAQGY